MTEYKLRAPTPYRKFLPTKKAPRSCFVRTADGALARVEVEARVPGFGAKSPQHSVSSTVGVLTLHGRCREGWGGSGWGGGCQVGVDRLAGGGWVGASCTVTAQSHREEDRFGAGRVGPRGRWSAGRGRPRTLRIRVEHSPGESASHHKPTRLFPTRGGANHRECRVVVV